VGADLLGRQGDSGVHVGSDVALGVDLGVAALVGANRGIHLGLGNLGGQDDLDSLGGQEEGFGSLDGQLQSLGSLDGQVQGLGSLAGRRGIPRADFGSHVGWQGNLGFDSPVDCE